MLLADGFCADTANIWRVLGLVVNVIKIVIPLVLIILGMLDLGKAVVEDDDKAINKAVTRLVKRFIAAVVMFFIPTIISAIFSMVVAGSDLNDKSSDTQICVQCLTNVNGNFTLNGKKVDCATYAENAVGFKEN